MGVERRASLPYYYKYVTENALICNYEKSFEKKNTNVKNWIHIPNYQRGVSWKIEDVNKIINSNSKLLGTVVASESNNIKEVCSNMNCKKYLSLIDGFQRFSIGTALLAVIDEKVFDVKSPHHSRAIEFFGRLRQATKRNRLVYLHNDQELLNHPRKVVSNQYTLLKDKISNMIDKQLSIDFCKSISSSINNMFLGRQIALDIYKNLETTVEDLNIFITHNTGRVNLEAVDILRSRIIDEAIKSNWEVDDINYIENEFSNTFIAGQKVNKLLTPFVKSILRQVELDGSRIFKSWNTDKFSKAEVKELLDYVKAFKNIINTNNYIYEIKECGTLALAIIMAYYYERKVINNESYPDFLSGGCGNDFELRKFLIACYRVILDGSIIRLEKYAYRILEGTNTKKINDIADEISKEFIKISIDEELNEDWLKVSLNKVSRERARRVFNMMLLPNKNDLDINTKFNKVIFGNHSNELKVDYLIPVSNKSEVANQEVLTIKNFAPLPKNLLGKSKKSLCSIKLDKNGIYNTYLESTEYEHHPYCKWLIDTFNSNKIEKDYYDKEEYLEVNKNPDIGEKRLRYIMSELLKKI